MSPRKNVIKIEVIDEDEIEEQKVARKKTQKKNKPEKKEPETRTSKKIKKSQIKKEEEVAETEAPVLGKASKAKKTTKKSEVKIKDQKTKKDISKKEVIVDDVKKSESLDKEPKEVQKKVNKENQVKISEIKEPSELEKKKPLKKLTRKKEKVNVLKTIKEEKSEDKKTKNDIVVSKKILEEEIEEPSFEDMLSKKSSKINEVIKESIIDEQEKMEEEVLTKKSFPTSKRSIKLYRRLAYFFIFLTVILISVVVYYSIVKVEITLIPNQERISNNLIFDVKDKDLNVDSGANVVLGIVREIDIEKEKTYIPSGEEVIGKEVVGEVVIYNNYSKNQPLVASTRLLSSDGKLYRLKKTVNVPAGGEVLASIYADEAEEDMVVGLTKFNIPGLWAGLQDKIFAESKEASVFQKKINRFVAKDDFETTERDLKQLMLVAAKEKVNDEYKDYSQILYKIDENSIASNIEAEPGEEVDSFDASMQAKVVVVAFNNQEAIKLAKQKFITAISDNKEVISFEDDKVIYSLNSFDVENGTAAINAQFSGKVSLKNDSEIIDIEKIVGLNQEQLEAYLADVKDIAGFEVSFRPSFIKRVPSLTDRINIEIKR